MHHDQTRRDFLKTSTSLATAATLGSHSLLQAAAKKGTTVTDAQIPIVDTHQHLWDLSKFTLPWLKNEGVESIRRSFVTSDYLKATKGANVVKTVYMEVNVHSDQQTKEAEHVIELCKQKDNPMAAAVIGGSPHKKSFKKYIMQFKGNPYIKGVRTVLHDPDRKKGMCLTPVFVENMKLLGELGMSYDLCMRPDEIGDGAKLAELCPETRFIIDHCGNMSVTSDDKELRKQWQHGMKAAAALENVVCKISGVVVTADKDTWKSGDLAPNVNFCMDTFGADRIFFGGDWPVCTLKATYTQWVDALKEIVRERSPKFKQKLFHDNAVRIYGLS